MRDEGDLYAALLLREIRAFRVTLDDLESLTLRRLGRGEEARARPRGVLRAAGEHLGASTLKGEHSDSTSLPILRKLRATASPRAPRSRS